MIRNKTVQGLLLLLILGFIWGSGYSIARYAMTHQVPPLGYSFWQSVGPACLLTIICLFKQDYSLFQRKNWCYFLICGLVGIAIPNTNMYFVAGKMDAGMLAVLVNTVPLIVYPLAIIFRQESKDAIRLLALLVGFFGLAYLLFPAKGTSWNSWHTITLVTPICFALCAIYISAAKRTIPSLSAAAGMLISASLLLTPIVIQQGAFYPLSWPMNLNQKVVILEIFLSSLGYLVFFRLIQLSGPVYYSLTGGVVAVTGIFWGVVLFHERPDMTQFIGTFLILMAIALLSWRQQYQLSQQEAAHA